MQPSDAGSRASTLQEAAGSLSGELLWIGPVADDELALARECIAGMVGVVEAASPAAAVESPPAAFRDRSPVAILLASPIPATWTLADGIALSRRWPLAPLVSVAATLVEGRRRSGPALPGIEEVAWNELPARLAWWLHDRERGLPGGLGMPATARREERVLEASKRIADRNVRSGRPIAVAAPRPLDVEGIVDLLTAAGRPVVRRTCGRPAIDELADVIVWDVAAITPTDLTWLAMVAANRPAAAIILLDSFPRGETTRAALRAGARAVLSRPVSLEALTGTLLDLDRPPGRPASGL